MKTTCKTTEPCEETSIELFPLDEERTMPVTFTLADVSREPDAWLTQAEIVQLLESSQQNVSHHINCIYEEGELEREATNKNFLLVRFEGTREVSRRVEKYNLEMVIALGFRIKSPVAIRFRRWANQRLRALLMRSTRQTAKPRTPSISEIMRCVAGYALQKPDQQRATYPVLRGMLETCGLDAASLPQPAALSAQTREVGGVPVTAMDVVMALREHEEDTGEACLTTPALAAALGLPGDGPALRCLGMCLAAWIERPLQLEEGGPLLRIRKRRRCRSTPQGTRDEVLYWLDR